LFAVKNFRFKQAGDFMELTSDLSTFSILVFGFLLGLKHATEADHLAAVSTIVSEKKNLFASSIVGGLWGIGHTISLLVVGLVVIFLKLQISEQLEARLEAGVGVMLVLLGLNALRNLYLTKNAHVHTHEHEGHAHLHTHSHDKKPNEKWHHNLSPRSVIIGMIHGLAGSAALMLLIVPNIKSPFVAVLYILIFGAGSIGGMMLMSFIFGLPFHFTATNLVSFNKVIRFAAAVFSFGLGLSIIYEKLFAV
jgi:high-affinity nickel permease